MALRAFRRKDEPTPDSGTMLIPLDLLNVDSRYQRVLEEKRVKEYVANFDANLLQALVVSERADGTYWVLDGFHRLEVMRLKGFENAQCQVLRTLTYEDEARVFHDLNKKRKAMNAWFAFRALVESKDREATAIVRTVEAAGFRIGQTDSPRSIKAIATLQRIYKLGGADLLGATLTFLSDTWAGEKDATGNVPLHGAAMFLKQYQGHAAFDYDSLVHALSKVPPATLIREVAAMDVNGGLVGSNGGAIRYCLVMRRHYNKGRRTRKLPLPVDSVGRVIGGYAA